MTFAVISDVHGNLPALEAVLEDARKRGAEEYIIAGDYCLSGPYPDECIRLLRGIENKHIIRGNEEQYLQNLIGKDRSKWTDGQMQISYWCMRNIGSDELEYLMSLPHTIDLSVGGTKVHIAHSSQAFIDFEFERFGPAVLAKKYPDDTGDIRRDIQDMLENDESIRSAVDGLEDGVYVFGHSHVQWSYSKGNVHLVNPGSCGLPLDCIKDSIPYTMLYISDSGEVRTEECRLPFDKVGYAEHLMASTQYKEANVWSKVITKELLTAREHLTFFLQYAEGYAQSIGDERRPFAVDTWERAYCEWDSASGN
ncbi:MAG: metallophosphoesterase family protein [Oscillospiraceae bacterium]|nr:metallophosphoesterase family protein [Oscillospiraceae bacterium]